MGVQLNHIIVWCSDKVRSTDFLCGLLALAPPKPFSIFLVVPLENGVSLDFGQGGPGPIAMQHYAFLMQDEAFQAAFDRIRAQGLDYWADPGRTEPGRTYSHNGGRGLYFLDPDGHLMEIMTRPYAIG
jgi:catechol 2,3-dioxygenase-like lactoylglutathione lyase family enzyme